MRLDPHTTEALDDLTERQREVACWLMDGLPEHEIAERLFVSEHTIHEHARHIYARLGCHNRAQLTRLLLRSGVCAREK